MNYFSHGILYLDRPYFLIGTALPDLMSVVDRQVRMRARRVSPFAEEGIGPEAEIAAGILQHLRDDAWFHATPAFAQVSAELTQRFRAVLPVDDAHRPSFLGHIVTEILLDGVLIAAAPSRLDAYYAALEQLDAQRVEQAVNRMARQPTDRLATFLPLFTRERFLADYLDPERLWFRLNQIMRRVKLSPLPEEVQSVLREGWSLVETRAGALLPGEIVDSVLRPRSA